MICAAPARARARPHAPETRRSVLSAQPSVPSGARATAARATMEALADSPDVFEEFFVSARIGLALADLDGSYVRVNRTYAELLGRPPEDLVGVRLADVLGDALAVDLADLAAGRREAVPSEQSYTHPDGTTTWVLHGVAAVAGPDGRPAWFAVSAQDITERRRIEEELRAATAALTEQAVRDPLTGLANRTLFEERLRGALSRDARHGGSTGVLFLDLDGFKDVNDQYGHAVGDTVLRTVAERLTAGVRPADTVARLGGDEFVVLVEGATPAGMSALVARLREAVQEPLLVRGETLDVGVSVGMALADGGLGGSGRARRRGRPAHVRRQARGALSADGVPGGPSVLRRPPTSASRHAGGAVDRSDGATVTSRPVGRLT